MSTAYMFDSDGPFAIEDSVLVQRALEARGIRRFEIAVRTEQEENVPIRIYAETPPRREQLNVLIAALGGGFLLVPSQPTSRPRLADFIATSEIRRQSPR
ncbi:MAG: hypothetical protein ABJE10_10655 [bacterium]